MSLPAERLGVGAGGGVAGEGVLKGLLGASARSLAGPRVAGCPAARPPLSHWNVPVMVMGNVSVTRVRLLAAVHRVQLMLDVPRIATVAVPSANAA